TVSTSSSTPNGTFTITVTGTASSGSHSTTFSLNVGNPQQTGTLGNPGFESGAMTPWTAQAGDAVVSTPVHSGTKALRVSPTDSQTADVDQVVTLQANHSYTLTGWVQGNFAFIGVGAAARAR